MNDGLLRKNSFTAETRRRRGKPADFHPLFSASQRLSGGFFLFLLQVLATGTTLCFAGPESAAKPLIGRELSWQQVVLGIAGLTAVIVAIMLWNMALRRAINVRTRALESVRKQNELLLHSAGEGIYGVDGKGLVTFINPAAAGMVGWGERELLGKIIHDIVHHTKKDGSACSAAECPIYAAFRDGVPHHSEDEMFWRKDGTRFPVECISTPIRDERGAILGAVVTFKDITWRRQAEAALRESNEVMERIFSMTTICIAYMDRDFNFIRVNEKYAESDGQRPGYFIGKNHFALYPNEENEAIFRRVVETGRQHIAHAKPFEYEDHPERGISHWDWSLTPITDPKGAVESVLLSLINVTDRIKAQEELSRLNAELEARVRERTTELEEKNAELERLNRLFVGRELRMAELKEQLAHREQAKGETL